MLDSLICDYNYKCLTFTVDETGFTDYIHCPHDMHCNINYRVCKSARGHYNRHSRAKGKKDSYKNISNPSVPAIKLMYQEYLRKGFKCVYCGQNMTLYRDCINSSTIDHITSRSLGGDNASGNLALCCWECNDKKAQREDVKVKCLRYNYSR